MALTLGFFPQGDASYLLIYYFFFFFVYYTAIHHLPSKGIDFYIPINSESGITQPGDPSEFLDGVETTSLL